MVRRLRAALGRASLAPLLVATSRGRRRYFRAA
jgi:hypothetical protein